MKRTVRWLLATLVAGALLLGVGDPRDPWLWGYALAFSSIGLYAIRSMDDDLAKERFTPPSSGADRLSLRWIRLIALAHVIVAVADARWGWTSVPPVLRGAGLTGFVLTFLLVVRAMRANRFFSAVVRIQHERGHTVVDTGPYAIVRHPGYAGMILFAPFSGMALGSWISVGVALIYSALVLRRVRFEDGFLAAHLPGYESYTRRVRHRLIPGVW